MFSEIQPFDFYSQSEEEVEMAKEPDYLLLDISER